MYGGKLLFLAYYNFTALVQRMFNCDEIRNINVTPLEVPNVLT